MIRFALAIVLFMLPSLVIAAIILALFPHIPSGLLIIFTLAIILGCAYIYVRRRKDYFIREGIPEQTPAWLNKKRYGFILIIASLLGSTAIFSSNKTTLYIDNGTDMPVTVRLKHDGEIKIPAHQYVSRQVVTGDNEGIFNERRIPMHITKDGKWIWNIGGKNTYMLSSVSYSSQAILYKNGRRGYEDDTEGSDDDYEIVKGEVIHTRADYLFTAPESITIKQSRFAGKKIVDKTVLYRLGDVADELLKEAEKRDIKQSRSHVEIADPAEGTNHTMDSAYIETDIIRE